MCELKREGESMRERCRERYSERLRMCVRKSVGRRESENQREGLIEEGKAVD